MKNAVEKDIAAYFANKQTIFAMALKGHTSPQFRRQIVREMDTILLAHNDGTKLNPYERASWLAFRGARNKLLTSSNRSKQRIGAHILSAFAAALPLVAATVVRKTGELMTGISAMVGDAGAANRPPSGGWIARKGHHLIKAGNMMDYWIGNNMAIAFQPVLSDDPHKKLAATGKAPANYKLPDPDRRQVAGVGELSFDAVRYHYEEMVRRYNQGVAQRPELAKSIGYNRIYRDLADAILYAYRNRSRLSLEERLSRDSLRVTRDIIARKCTRDEIIGEFSGGVGLLTSLVTFPLRVLLGPLAVGPLLEPNSSKRTLSDYVLIPPKLVAMAVMAVAKQIDQFKNYLLPPSFEALDPRWQKDSLTSKGERSDQSPTTKAIANHPAHSASQDNSNQRLRSDDKTGEATRTSAEWHLRPEPAVDQRPRHVHAAHSAHNLRI